MKFYSWIWSTLSPRAQQREEAAEVAHPPIATSNTHELLRARELSLGRHRPVFLMASASEWAPAGYESYRRRGVQGARSKAVHCCGRSRKQQGQQPALHRHPDRWLHIEQEVEKTPELQRGAAWAALHTVYTREQTAAALPAGQPAAPAAVTIEPQSTDVPSVSSQLAIYVGVVAAGCSALWHCQGSRGLTFEWSDAAAAAIVVLMVALLVNCRSNDETQR